MKIVDKISKDIPWVLPIESSYKCECGRVGFVEVKDDKNRYPCRECYLRKDQK